MRELIQFSELRNIFNSKESMKYISKEIQDHWDSKTSDPEYLAFCYENPEYLVKATKCGIHAEVIGTEGSFFVGPDDYICMCVPFYDVKNAEILVKPQDSFEKNYVRFN